jgi:ABC-type amino acid transport substrate-binding protein
MLIFFIIFFILLIILILFKTKVLLYNNFLHIFLSILALLFLFGGFFIINKLKNSQNFTLKEKFVELPLTNLNQSIVSDNLNTESSKIKNLDNNKYDLTIKVGVSNNRDPYVNKESGLEVDIIKTIALNLNAKLIFIPIQVKDIDTLLINKTIDVALAGLTASNLSSKNEIYTNFYTQSNLIFFGLKTTTKQLKSFNKKQFINNLNNKTIGVLSGGQDASYLAKELKGKNIIIKSYNSVNEIYRDILSKKIYLGFIDENFIVKTPSEEIDILQNTYLVKNKVGFAFKINNTTLKDNINIQIESLKISGYIDNLFYNLKKYDAQ